jgi:hypothetical protein
MGKNKGLVAVYEEYCEASGIHGFQYTTRYARI